MAKNILLGCLIGLIVYVSFLEEHHLMGLRAAFDDKQSFLSEVNVEKTCLKLQSSLNELKDGKNNDRNVKYHWSYLSCSKILSYNSMEKVCIHSPFSNLCTHRSFRILIVNTSYFF